MNSSTNCIFVYEFMCEFVKNFVTNLCTEFVRIHMNFLHEKLVMLRMACTVKTVLREDSQIDFVTRSVPTPTHIIWLSSSNFFRGGQNLLLCKFLLLCYCFWTKFQGGQKFSGGNCLRGGGASPVEESHIIGSCHEGCSISFKISPN